jgi:hypothetical protein
MCAAALAALPAFSHADDPPAQPSDSDWGYLPESPPAGTVSQPAMPAPTQQPPAAGAGVPDGQWVYTSQYGWVWMPYGNSFTSSPADATVPFMYVYGPAFGWAWVGAPWVWGYGPGLYFSVGFRVGYPFYAFYGHPYFYGVHYRPFFYGGRYWYGHAPWGGWGGYRYGPRVWGGAGPAPRAWGGAGPAPAPHAAGVAPHYGAGHVGGYHMGGVMGGFHGGGVAHGGGVHFGRH